MNNYILIFAIILGFSLGVLVTYQSANNETMKLLSERPLEQTYEYLFNKTDSSPSNIVRVNYHNKTYLIFPLLIENCSPNDPIMITQDCKSGDYFKWGENEYRIWKENE